MGALAWTIFTVFWGLIGVVVRTFVPNGPNKGVIQVGLALSAACCYLLWLCAYMSQMNPLIGPQLNNITLSLMARA